MELNGTMRTPKLRYFSIKFSIHLLTTLTMIQYLLDVSSWNSCSHGLLYFVYFYRVLSKNVCSAKGYLAFAHLRNIGGKLLQPVNPGKITIAH